MKTPNSASVRICVSIEIFIRPYNQEKQAGQRSKCMAACVSVVYGITPMLNTAISDELHVILTQLSGRDGR